MIVTVKSLMPFVSSTGMTVLGVVGDRHLLDRRGWLVLERQVDADAVLVSPTTADGTVTTRSTAATLV